MATVQLSSASFCSSSGSKFWKMKCPNVDTHYLNATTHTARKSVPILETHECKHATLDVFIRDEPLCEIPHGYQCLCVHVCVFPQFSHKDSVKRVSAYQTWVFFYPAFQFSIDLGRVTLKRPEKHRSTKKSRIPFLHQKDSLGPGWFSSQARYWCWPGFITWRLEPERNRGGAKYLIAFGGKLSGLVPARHPSYHPPLSLCQSVFFNL